MKLFKSESPNKYIQKAQNQLITQQSIRLLQYINMYNLKRDQILYQCPIFKSQIKSQDFEIQVQCIQEMADVQVIYNRQRKQQIMRIRNQQKLIQEKLQKQKKSQGFFSKLFSSKDKNKNNITPEKPKINMSSLRSSVYLSKNNMNSSSIVKQNKLLNSVTTNFYANQSKLANAQSKQQDITPGKDLDQTKIIPSNIKNTQPIPKPQDIQKTQPQKQQPKINNQLIQQDIDIDDLLDVVNQSVEEKKKMVKKMTSIQQQSQQDEKSRIKINVDIDNSIIKQGSQGDSVRDSRVTRLLKQQDQNLDKSKASVKSKRITQRSRAYNNDQQEQQISFISKSEVSESKEQINEKDNKNVKQNGNSFKKKKVIGQIKENNQKPQKIKTNLTPNPKTKTKNTQKQTQNFPQPINQSPNASPKPKPKPKTKKQDPLRSYIQSQISRLTQKIDSQIDISSVDLLDASSLSIKNSQHKSQLRQDSYSDIKIDWMVKLQSCQMQQKLLINRIKNRWNKPMQCIKKIRNIHMHNFTPDIANNPKYQFMRPNLNFGTIIQ